MRATWFLRAIWLAAGLALLLPFFRDAAFSQSRPVKLAASIGAWTEGDLRPDGFYIHMDHTGRPRGHRVAGTWQGDEWQGEGRTHWWPVSARALRVVVAGYPQHAGIRLVAEFRTADGRVEARACDIPNPGDGWKPWDIAVPRDAVEVRIAAADRATDAAGWVAFAEPMVRPSSMRRDWFMAAQTFTAIALALTLVWGPGLIWSPGRLAPELRSALLLGAGPALLVASGLLIWALGGVVSPRWLGLGVTAAVWLAVGDALWQPVVRHVPRGLGIALALSALAVTAVASKAAFAGGPSGELYAGTISRTLEVGDRSDARIPYHVVQVVARHYAPMEPAAVAYFAPWTFFSRGPLGGLAAAPVVLATGGAPPRGMPDDAWAPFDEEGFAAYRIVLMTLAAGAVVALFVAVAAFAAELWAIVAAGLFVLAPFGLHDIMFTWPKFAATAWIVMSFVLAHRRRPALGGLALGVGFLFHPLALLWAPWLALWAWRPAKAGHYVRDLRHAVTFGAVFSLVVIAWMGGGALAPRSPLAPFAQSSFLDYFRMADGQFADWNSWWASRRLNLANTFLPFWLYLANADSRWVRALSGQTDSIVRFAFGWWNTLPLGLGLLAFGLSIPTLARAARRYAAAFLLLIVCPALFIAAYWGSYASGLMRECGHPLFAAWIGLTCVTLSRMGGRVAAIVAHPIFPWLQLPEVLLMLWLTTWLNAARTRGDLDVVYLTTSVLALAAAGWMLSRARQDTRSPGPSGPGT